MVAEFTLNEAEVLPQNDRERRAQSDSYWYSINALWYRAPEERAVIPSGGQIRIWLPVI